jgi:outer membrane receptor for ferric coprogen and ferric-rhodotorulic acid
VFRLEQTNLAERDDEFGISPVCDDWYYSRAAGKVISEGVDVSLNGALTPNWHVGAGYTYVTAEYATGEDKGERYGTTNPHHAFRLASTYRIPGSNWTVGGNLRAQSAVYSDHGVARIKQSGYSLVDLMARYQIGKQAEITVNATNVFDRRYRYPNVTTATHYGEPRRLMANVKFWF